MNRKFKLIPFRFKVGDFVRISHLKYPFQRDYQQKWTEEVFKVKSRFRREGIPLYSLADLENDAVDGNYCQQELQKVSKSLNNKWKIEKVLKRRIRNKKPEVFVKWRGWPKKFNSWVSEADIDMLWKGI